MASRGVMKLPALQAAVKQLGETRLHADIDDLFERFASKKVDRTVWNTELIQLVGRDTVRKAVSSLVSQSEMAYIKAQRQQGSAGPRPAAPTEEGAGAPGAASFGTRINATTTADSATTANGATAPNAANHPDGASAANGASSRSDGSSSTQRDGSDGAASAGSRRPNLPVKTLVHGVRCTNAECTFPECAEAKRWVGLMARHARTCQLGPTLCKPCKLWHVLSSSRSRSSESMSASDPRGSGNQQVAPPPQRLSSTTNPPVPPSAEAAAAAPSSTDAADQEQRKLAAAAIKKQKILEHLRNCKLGQQCRTCVTIHRHAQRVHQQRQQMAMQQQLAAAGRAQGGLMNGLSMNSLAMGLGANNFLASRIGSMAAALQGQAGWPAAAGFSGGGGRSLAPPPGFGSLGMPPGRLAPPGSPAARPPLSARGFPSRPADGQRTADGPRMRGRDNVSGVSAPSRAKSGANGGAASAAQANGPGNPPAAKAKTTGGMAALPYQRVLVKLKSEQPFERTAEKKKSHKKRPTTASENETTAAVKRQRVVKQEVKQDLLDEPQGDIRHASDRQSSDELNRYEAGQVVEVLWPHPTKPQEPDWRLAVVQGWNAQRGYKVRYQTTEQFGQVQDNVQWCFMRRACMHPECRCHALHLAALPVVCSRCRTDQLRVPPRGSNKEFVYYQESEEARDRCGGQVAITLCMGCKDAIVRAWNSANYLARDEALLQETQKFMPDRTSGLLVQRGVLVDFTKWPVPQRDPIANDKDAPLMLLELDLHDNKPVHVVDDRWIQCDGCHQWRHWTCALYDDMTYGSKRPYFCVSCAREGREPQTEEVLQTAKNNDARTLESIPMSSFIENAVADDLAAAGCECEPVTIRVVSCQLTQSRTPRKIIDHMEALGDSYPHEFPYKSKALLAFQKIGGLDVCLFALYVQEYGSDCPAPNKDRVYISYLDSVPYFSEGVHRTTLYHAMLVAYLQWARLLGNKFCHIWVSPPKIGDEYIFFAREKQQKKPMKVAKLREWYVKMLDKAKEKGIVESYGPMHEHFESLKSLREIPLFSGDQWQTSVQRLLDIDEAEYAMKLKEPLTLKRMDAKDVVADALREMKHRKGEFLVVAFSPLADGEAMREDGDKVLSDDFTDSRDTFLSTMQWAHWEFRTLRHAQHATRMILNKIHTKQSYCIEGCYHGNVDDGSFMICCDQCLRWCHGDCVGRKKEELTKADTFKCTLCAEEAVGMVA